MADDQFEAKEFLDRVTGKAYRIYTYKRRPCARIQLTSRLAEQLAGYTMIEKDLRKRSTNYALALRSEFWDAGVHVNKVDTCDGEQLRNIERLGAGTHPRWALPL